MGRKERSRITIGALKIETHINVANNVTIEKIELYYLPDKRKRLVRDTDKGTIKEVYQEPLVGEKVYFEISEHNKNAGSNKDFKIIAVKASGWNIITVKNNSSIVILENYEYKNMLSSYINIVLEIQNQDQYRRRVFNIYNRNAIEFEASIIIEDDYEFIGFDTALPYKLKKEKNISSYEDFLDMYCDSIVLSEQVLRNKINFKSWLRGDDFKGSNIYNNFKPKKIIDFSFTYDYREDTNIIIAKGSKYAMWLAIVLFFCSVIISFLDVKYKTIKLRVKGTKKTKHSDS